MTIAQGVDVKIGIFDIETLKEMFHFGMYDPDSRQWIDFEVSRYRNTLYPFVKFYLKNDFEYFISYNGISFDHQVLQFVINNYEKWYDLTNLEVTGKIYNFVQKLIEDQSFDIRPPYNESNFPVKSIDLFKIHHFDNEAKRTSLKWCEFMMNMDVEEMPIHSGQENLTEEDCQMIRDYEKHDILATLALLYLTIGQVDKVEELLKDMLGFEIKVEELADYNGKNKIQDRLDFTKETGLPCLNWSDVKIGEEWNKMDYIECENIKFERDVFPKKVKHPYGQKFKNFFPKTMKFTTKNLQDFIEKLGNKYVLAEKQEFPITIGETTYTVAKGGIHSTEKNRKIVVPPGYTCSDADVGAQYPNSIIKLEIFPPHLKRTIIVNFIGTVAMKDTYKQLGKEASANGEKLEALRLKGLEGGTKLRMNGGYYGKLGQKGSFLEYPEGLLKVCMSNQIEILMLIEMMEVAGFKVISGNTDGIVTMYPTDRESEYLAVCKAWEEQVGNDKMGKLEYAKITGMWQDNINSYIAQIDEKGTLKTKKKGRFVTVYGSPGCELNKNKSARIIPLALEAYFIDSKNPVEFITSHKNIFDFCIAKKAAGKLHYEEILNDKEVRVHKKLIRYFISNNGNVMMKRGINNEGNEMNNHCEATDKDFPWMGQPKVTYFNRFYKSDNYDINYSYYILETLKRIDNICKTKMAKNYADKFKVQQTTLF